MSTTDRAVAGTAVGLRRDAIGLREVLFQSITDMAPGAAIAASIPAGAGLAGGALPLSVLFAWWWSRRLPKPNHRLKKEVQS